MRHPRCPHEACRVPTAARLVIPAGGGALIRVARRIYVSNLSFRTTWTVRTGAGRVWHG